LKDDNKILKDDNKNLKDENKILKDGYKILNDERTTRHNRLLLGQLGFCLERNVVKGILENRSPYALRTTTMSSIYEYEIQFTNLGTKYC
jgi:hypothetical protein